MVLSSSHKIGRIAVLYTSSWPAFLQCCLQMLRKVAFPQVNHLRYVAKFDIAALIYDQPMRKL